MCALLATCTARTASAFDAKKEGKDFAASYAACELLARAKDEARFASARACLASLVPRAKSVETKAELEYRRAEWLERAGSFTDARDAFLVLAHNYPREEMAARARFRAARVLEDRLEQTSAALAEYRALVREAPDSIAALNALVHLEESLSDEQCMAFYDAELAARPKTRLATTLLAHLGEKALRQKDGARAAKAFDALAARDAGSKADDALYEGARAHLLLGDRSGAIARLERLIASKEFTLIASSLIPAGLHTSKLDDARFLLGEIARSAGDAKAARAHFEKLLSESPESRLVDDALHALIALSDAKAAAEYQKKLATLRPASRFLRSGKR